MNLSENIPAFTTDEAHEHAESRERQQSMTADDADMWSIGPCDMHPNEML